jgi:hypothetical protein
VYNRARGFKSLADKQTVKMNYEILEKLFKIPLDISGSNIAETGWYPDENFEGYADALKEYQEGNKNVLFKNVSIETDSCDCNSGYGGCNCGSWVYRINVGEHNIEVEYEENLFIENKKTEKYCTIPARSSIGYFYVSCIEMGINVELSDYAKSLINKQ